MIDYGGGADPTRPTPLLCRKCRNPTGGHDPDCPFFHTYHPEPRQIHGQQESGSARS